MAAGRGHLSTVQWFYGNGIPGDIAKAIEKAQEGGHVEVRTHDHMMRGVETDKRERNSRGCARGMMILQCCCSN